MNDVSTIRKKSDKPIAHTHRPDTQMIAIINRVNDRSDMINMPYEI